MRFTGTLLLATASLSSAIWARSSSQGQHVQIYLHPSPSSPHASAPTLTPDQAKAVMNHHLGEAASDFDEIPADEGLWSHLVGMWGKPGWIGMPEQQTPRVIIIDGDVDAQTVLPTSFSREPAFFMASDDETTSFLQPYLHRANSFLQDVMSKLPSYIKDFVDDFELAGTKVAATMQNELSALIALTEKDIIPYLAELGHSAWQAIHISALGQLEQGSTEWREGAKGVQAGLESMAQPNSPPLIVILVPQAQSHFHHRRSAVLDQRAKNDSSPACYSSESACSDSTSCSGHGACAMLAKAGDKECWGCRCASGYAGSECQKSDYTVPFVILIFSTVMLVAIVIGSISLLWTIGETKLPSTLTLAVGGHLKRD